VAEDDRDDAALTPCEVFLDSNQLFLGALGVLALKNLITARFAQDAKSAKKETKPGPNPFSGDLFPRRSHKK
jgi:hypothetical protein